MCAARLINNGASGRKMHMAQLASRCGIHVQKRLPSCPMNRKSFQSFKYECTYIKIHLRYTILIQVQLSAGRLQHRAWRGWSGAKPAVVGSLAWTAWRAVHIGTASRRSHGGGWWAARPMMGRYIRPARCSIHDPSHATILDGVVIHRS
jgi:hypothetical protein